MRGRSFRADKFAFKLIYRTPSSMLISRWKNLLKIIDIGRGIM